jgi:methionine-rich copper-binding protein CopC
VKTNILAAGLLAVASLAGGIALAPAAQAHSELISTDPADGAVLEAPPRQVSFTFNEPLMPDFVRFIGTDPAGQTGDLPVSFVDGATAGIVWPAEAPAGEWRVSYRVVSQDGHPIEGGITFTYTAPSPAPTSTSATPSPTSATPTSPTPTSPSPTTAAPTEATPSPEVSPAADTGGGSTGWVIAGIALAVIVVAGVVFALLARRRT